MITWPDIAFGPINLWSTSMKALWDKLNKWCEKYFKANKASQ